MGEVVAQERPRECDLRSLSVRAINTPTLRLRTRPGGPRGSVSTIKLRKAWLNAAVDTRDALRGALQFDHISRPRPRSRLLYELLRSYTWRYADTQGADNGISPLPNTHHRQHRR